MNKQIEELHELGEHIAGAMPDAVRKFDIRFGDLTLYAERDAIASLAEFLKRDTLCNFESLMDICGVDYPERGQRFEVVYHFLSMRMNHRVRVPSCIRALTGSSVRRLTCMVSALPGTRTCAVF